jgi:hypothetical protein
MPDKTSDPATYSAWIELVHMKTRSLELQIAEARLKEKEAELELVRLRAGVPQVNDEARHASSIIFSNNSAPSVNLQAPSPNREFDRLALTGFGGVSHVKLKQPKQEQVNPPASALAEFPFVTSQLDSISSNNLPIQPTQTPMTPYDLEVMMQEDNLDSLFAWLPNYNDSMASTQVDQLGTINPSMLSYDDLQTLNTPFDISATTTSPQKRRSISPSSDNSDREPPSKRKKTLEKKVVIDHSIACLTCKKPLGRIMIRAPKSSVPSPATPSISCLVCTSVEVMQRGPMIGTVDSRKRLRVSMEVDDDDKKGDEEKRRVFCDVCQRVVGSGGIWGGVKGKNENLGGMTEVVCTGCDGKYQR